MTAHPIDREALWHRVSGVLRGHAFVQHGRGVGEHIDLSPQAADYFADRIDRIVMDALAAAEARAIRAEAQSEARRIDIAYWTARAQMMGRKRDAGLRDLAHVQKERDNALARIEAVRELHRSDGHDPDVCGEPGCFEFCLGCYLQWPCPTIRALEE